VKVYLYGGRSADLWWNQNRQALERLENATVMDLPQEITVAMKKMAAKSMRLDCTIQDGEIWLASGGETLHFRTRPLLEHGA
jgi:uncharacterized protein YaeQ